FALFIHFIRNTKILQIIQPKNSPITIIIVIPKAEMLSSDTCFVILGARIVGVNSWNNWNRGIC
ncbi:hypothetical protein, partial [Salmonella sp. s54412]|uniref:hypothetical protein n=1 Tax=unclassified Salmonella TaxID=2614656 RepID=UPI0037548AE5